MQNFKVFIIVSYCSLVSIPVDVVGQARDDLVEVTLFKHPQYEGNSISLAVDRCQNVGEFENSAFSVRTSSCVILYEDPCCQGPALVVPRDTSRFPLRFGGKASSVSPCGGERPPFPNTTRESWMGHREIMKKVSEDDDVAIYYNSQMRRTSLPKHQDFFKRMWDYVKGTFGDFGPEGDLLVFFHANAPRDTYRYLGGRSYFEPESNCQNIVDLPNPRPEAWQDFSGDHLDAVCHIVSQNLENSAKGVRRSPTSSQWRNKFAEIFAFDVYKALGLNSEMDRAFDKFSARREDFPRRNTFWFRDWFFPVYRTYGEARLLNRYFELLATYFPREGNGWQYERRKMNLGEMVHFFSGAAGVDLRSQAEAAFGWNAQTQQEWERAKLEFPKIEYFG